MSLSLVPSGGDDSGPLQATISRCPPGGVIRLIPAVYQLASVVTIDRPLSLVGEGQACDLQAPQGSSQWTLPGHLGGTVLRCPGSGGVYVLGRARGVHLRGLALVGPGMGPGVSFFDATNATLCTAENVLLANWDTGLELQGCVQTRWQVQVTGCGVGVHLAATAPGQAGNAWTTLDDVTVQGCGTAVLIEGGAQTKISGVIQANQSGIVARPTLAALTGLHLDGVHFEDNALGGLSLDCTVQPIEVVSLLRTRWAADSGPLLIQGTRPLTHLTAMGNEAPGVLLLIPPNVRGGLVAGNQWAAVPTNLGSGVEVFDVV